MKLSSNHSLPNAPGHHRTRCSGRFWTVAGIVAIISIATILALVPVHALQISAVKKNNVVFLQRVSPGDRFSTGYVHSVELSPVQEYFYIDSHYRMVLTETTFKSSNVGLPYAAFGKEVFHTEADGFRISNMHRTVPQLLIWAHRSYDNRLQFKRADLALYEFKGNTLIQVRIETLQLGCFALAKAAIWMDLYTKEGTEE